ncbi:2-dehydropantoate 2-reductase [Microbulbifer sp. OS29]|uniref:2-dehydropantoate 2-reductase n=1 Tax=Microbulbifer okhotskensis TaxID=2926617 RepID=A0A9X2EU56_9GAMM|nr:2-dehydropantoate 2-reductase [Microbulbifer okhotskensis]MCO1335871.1 2-dehydropantoate 2-reductase [Microbulbifer okhotskensis]
MPTKKHYLVFGAGAIGTTLAAWLNSSGVRVSIFDKPEACVHINQHGLEVYFGDQPKKRYRSWVQAYSNFNSILAPDVIILCVKNYSLEAVSKLLVANFGSTIPIVALQNGVENQNILPKYFDKIVYGVVCYNAWVDGFGVVGYQKKGPIALGYIDNVIDADLSGIVEDFNRGVETKNYPSLNDAAHSKIVINLTNSLTTLVALHKNDQANSKRFQILITSMIFEGVQVMKAAGYKESKLGGMPSWLLIAAASVLPGFITRKAYLKNLKKMVVSSMAQDIIVNGGNTSELESINGYVLSLANAYDVKTPVNSAIYQICKSEFVKSPFKPVTVDYIWKQVKRHKILAG